LKITAHSTPAPYVETRDTKGVIKVILGGVPVATADAVMEFVGDIGALNVVASARDAEADANGRVDIDFYCNPAPDTEAIAALPNHLEPLIPGVTLAIRSEAIEERDWVSEAQSGLSPIVAGRFFVHGAHDRAHRRFHACPIEIEAGQAFGTGHHGTTAGCLETFDRLLRHSRPARVLDLGSGSGVLAIAAAKAAKAHVVASDIDPVAVAVASENVGKNGVRGSVRCCVASGITAAEIARWAPYDLVFANILARPLIALAPAIRSVLAIGGRAILSGLTPDQEARVIDAYRIESLLLRERTRLSGWSTLVVC